MSDCRTLGCSDVRRSCPPVLANMNLVLFLLVRFDRTGRPTMPSRSAWINQKSDGQDMGYDTAIPDMAASHEAPLASSFRHFINARG